MNNFYFEVYNDQEPLEHINIRTEQEIWRQICKSPEYTTDEMLDKFHQSPYDWMHHQDFKKKLLEIYPDFITIYPDIDFNREDIHIRMIPQIEYRQYDEKFDNEMKFLEYIQSEKASTDKRTPINFKILEDAGFKFRKDESKLIGKYQKEEYGINDYVMYQLWTNDKNPIKLDIDNGWNNRGTKWSLHIDNDACETIGYANINNVWEFNTLMEVFGSKFRL
jgi:hypothetical protein